MENADVIVMRNLRFRGINHFVMIRKNWHTHTKRCGHAVGEDEEYVQAAIQAGVEVLGFSDHIPFEKPAPTLHMSMEEYPGYVASIRRLKEKYRDQITIYTGIEAEYYPEQIDYLRKVRKELDYMILGQHWITLEDENTYEIRTPNALMRYCDRIEQACSENLVDYICHPDVCLWSYPRYDEAVTETARRIADTALKYGVPVELNCGSGVRDYGFHKYEDGERYAYPSKPFFKVFAERHVPVIIGMDIHDPRMFLTDEYLNRALSIVKEFDLNFVQDYDIIASANEKKAKIQ